MNNTQVTQLALHEQRISNMENYQSKIENKIDQLLTKLDNQYVLQKNYEKDLKILITKDTEVEQRLQCISETMVTLDQMKSYTRSQFWQKVMTSAGTAVITLVVALIVYELTK
jgi:hypothetical protein